MFSGNKLHLTLPKVLHFGRVFYSKTYAEEFHVDKNNELLHIIDGQVRLRFKSGEEYIGRKNDTLFIPSGVYHKDIFEMSKGLEVFHITFDWGMEKQFFAEAAPDCLNNITGKARNELLLLFDMMRLDEPVSENVMLMEMRLGHLLGLAWRHVFSAANELNNKDSFSRITAYAKNYMMGNLSENISIDSVAEHLRISRSTLVRAFRKASEVSFNEYLRRIRMQYAFVLLSERTFNLTDCAERCGFSNPVYFSKVFKKYYGFSPKNIK